MKFNAFCQFSCFLCVYFRVSVYYLRVLSTTDGPCSKKESVQADVAYTLFFIVADSGHRSADRNGISVLESGVVLEAQSSQMTARVPLASVAPSLLSRKAEPHAVSLHE